MKVNLGSKQRCIRICQGLAIYTAAAFMLIYVMLPNSIKYPVTLEIFWNESNNSSVKKATDPPAQTRVIKILNYC